MISTNLRPAWSTRRVSGQLRLQSETTSSNKTNAIEQYWQNWASERGPGQEGRSGFQPAGQGVRGFLQTLPLDRGEEVPESPSHLQQESGLLGPLKPCPNSALPPPRRSLTLKLPKTRLFSLGVAPLVPARPPRPLTPHVPPFPRPLRAAAGQSPSHWFGTSADAPGIDGCMRRSRLRSRRGARLAVAAESLRCPAWAARTRPEAAARGR